MRIFISKVVNFDKMDRWFNSVINFIRNPGRKVVSIHATESEVVRFITWPSTHVQVCMRARRISCSLVSACPLGRENWILLHSKVKTLVERTLLPEALVCSTELTELLTVNCMRITIRGSISEVT
jgi:hypothetical protein